MKTHAHIIGWGMAVPKRILTNREISRMVDTTEEWIVSRTGIHERRIAGPQETTASLGLAAARKAIEVAAISPGEIDLIIVATSTPEHMFPATASIIQDALGARKAGAFDLLAACTGFVYALSLASQAIVSGSMNTVLVIGSETMSRIVNWEDRGTCILFGDGAGAFVLRGSEQRGGVLSTLLRSDGSGADLLSVPAGGSRKPASIETLRDNLHTIQMNGSEVFRFATKVMVDACQQVVADAGLRMSEIDRIVPHQANERIVAAAARGLKLPADRFVLNLERYGNTSTASIPIALCEAVAAGTIKPNTNIVFVAFGGGLTWGAALVRWDVTVPAAPSSWRRLQLRAFYGFSRVRSALRRGARTVEGFIFGKLSREGEEPPHAGKS
ncbi:MAG: ketoacyl-ACP synthase III [Chloroflexi bacterium]|nr:ketoacyl-ACP synthase III [Chloroflexota bacterium]